ncbi:hypothetical protein ACFLQL_00015 [Verrucomicrobiota bacterium]
MSQIVGLHSGIDQTKNAVVRSPLLSVPLPASPDNLKPPGGTYVQQTVQLTDDRNNGAAHVRIANGGYRTVQRVINIALDGDAKHTVRLVNNVGSGTLGFSRIDGFNAPVGFLKLLDDRDESAPFILSPGMTISLDPNMHRLTFQGSGCDVNGYAIISYAMEIYISNIVFDAMPAIGDLISFGEFAVLEFCEEGVPGTVAAGNWPVEIPSSALIVDLCTNLIDVFNTDYIAAVQPAASQTPFNWANMIDADDLIYYKESSSGDWLIATDKGVQFNSTNAAMIRNTVASVSPPNLQIYKQL